jgi:NAD+ diphosphatase
VSARLKLAALAYDKAAYRRSDEAWLARMWLRARVLLVTPTPAVLARRATDGTMQLALRGSSDVPADAPRRFLGLVDGEPYFSVTTDADDSIDAEAEGGDWATLRELGAELDVVRAGLLTAAIALEQWHQRHPRCPLCGVPTVQSHGGWTRVCPSDGSEHFPRTDPAIITLVHDGGDRCLLGRNMSWAPGRYSTLAGFVDAGESLEAAVVREIREEVSVRVTDVRYVASQPWPFPSSLMLGFSARVDGEQLVRPDHVEMAEAGWFTREEVRRAAWWSDNGTEPEPDVALRHISPPLSISRYLIDCWLDGDLP